MDGAFEATLPPDCVFTLVGFDPARTAVSVLITNPPEGALYTAPATIPIQASAITSTGSISQVEFFCSTTNLGEALTPPYEITWSNVPPGTYVLTARATNSIGNYGLSPSTRITVVGPATQISITPSNASVVPYGTLQFTATARDALGAAVIQQPVFSWSATGGTVDANGLFTAGGSAGGQLTVTASNNGLSGTANVSITTNLNLAPYGVGYRWYSLTSPTHNWPRGAAAGINDGDLNTDVHLFPGNLEEDVSNAYEAAGILWPAPQTINRVVYYNGSLNEWNDGVFAAEFGLQFSHDGITWTDAGTNWTFTPPYEYSSAASANTNFIFTGGMATVYGVRCVGRVHTAENGLNSWVAFATELQAFAAPATPPPVLAASAVSNGIALSWPAPLTNYILEAATNALPPDSWSPVTNEAQVVGDVLTVTVPTTPTCLLFRLRQQ